MNIQPTKLERRGERELIIEWSDGQRLVYTYQQLRDACPCATCREKRSAPKKVEEDPFTILAPEEARPTTIEGMHPVGAYAYGIRFSDGHDSGIFSFDLLRSLGKDE